MQDSSNFINDLYKFGCDWIINVEVIWEIVRWKSLPDKFSGVHNTYAKHRGYLF